MKEIEAMGELKKLIEDVGIPQTKIASKIGYSFSTLNRVLNGQQKPGPELSTELAKLTADLKKMKGLKLASGL